MVAYNNPHANINDYCNCHCHLYVNPIQLCYCNCRIKITTTTPDQTENYNIESEKIYNEQKIKELSLRLELLEEMINLKCQKNSESTNPFEYIKVDKKGLEDMRHIKNVLHEFYKWLMINVPDNRERSIAISRLEEATMWLNKSISRNKG